MPIRVHCPQFATSAHLLLLLLLICSSCGGNGGASTSSNATITGVSISPTAVNLTPAQSQIFTVTVSGTGAFNSTVNWSVNGVRGGNSTIGSVSDAGLYTAPNTVPTSSTVLVTATSVGDASKSASAKVNIASAVGSSPTVLSISPTRGAPGDELTVTGENFGSVLQTVVFSGPNGLPIATLVAAESGTSLTVKVPLEALSGPLIVQVPTSNGTMLSSNPVQFTRVPDVRIRAGRKDLGSGEGTSFQAVTFGDPVAQTLVWSTDLGSISSAGEYLAPGSVASDTFAHVNACIQGTDTCDTVLVGIHPFRVGPDAPSVALGQQLQLQSLVSGYAVSADWSQITGGGSLTSDGAYTASSALSDGGSALVSADYQGSSEQASVSVTGAFPGIVNRVYDYLDLTTTQIQRVTQPLSVAVYGSRAYVLAAQLDAAALDQTFLYIDVYDLTDPERPRWITAVEAANRGELRAFGGVLYDIGSPVGSQVMSAYDISSATPVLVGRVMLPDLFSFSFFGGVVTATEQSSYPAGSPAVVDEFYLGGGNIIEGQISVPPALSGTSYALAAASVQQSRLYVTETSTSASASSILASYDLSQSSPLLIGTVPLPETTLTSDSFGNGSLFFTDNKVFDITKDPPVLDGSLPEAVAVIDADSTRVLGQSIANGSAVCVQLVDVSNPEKPQTTRDLCDFDNGLARTEQARLNGSVVYSAEEMGGLTVYDVSASGGQHFLAQLGDPEPGGFTAYGQVANTTTLFAAGFDGLAGLGGVEIYNLQTQPPTWLTFVSTGVPSSNDVSLSSNNLFVATEQDLQIFDISEPNQPNQLGSLSVATNCVAASGNVLFLGSADGRLLVYSAATPSSPVLLATVTLPDTPVQMVLDNSLLLVADRNGGLMTFDVSNPSDPILVSQLIVPPSVFGVQVDGTTVLLAALESGLVVVDLSNPSIPKIVSETQLDSDDPFEAGLSGFRSRAVTVSVSDKIAFLGINNMDPNGLDNGFGSVYGFDYSRPSNPRLVSSARFTPAENGTVNSVLVAGTNLYASGFAVGILQVDISNARNLIDLYYPPSSLRPPFLPPPKSTLSATERPSRRSELSRGLSPTRVAGRLN
jgi:hypothetical protein